MIEDQSDKNKTTDQQREVACYLWLSPYHPETWPMAIVDRLVALRRRDERAFRLEMGRLNRKSA